MRRKSMTREEKKEYQKAWREAHKDKVKAWNAAHKDERKAYNQAHREEPKEYGKAWREAHKESEKAKLKAWKEANKEHCNEYMKDYTKADVNSLGQTKQSIRLKSKYILKKMNLNIPGYEIHHCFGYEDPSKFIYISRALHRTIHQYLRDNNIDASNDHWMAIRDLVNSTDEFMYIKC